MERFRYVRRLQALAGLFLKLGTIGFGGLVVQIAMMEEETVKRRKWLTRQAFLDIVGATNLVPGPNAVEVALHLGYLHAGWAGFMVAGLCFILPSVLITGGIAWGYVQFGALPQVAPLLYGIKPAVLAIILTAVWKLGRTAIKTWQLAVIGVTVIGAALLGLNEVLAIVLGGILGMVWLRSLQGTALPGAKQTPVVVGWLFPILSSHKQILGSLGGAVAGGTVAGVVSLWALGWFFLKVGAVLFGNGYVLVAFLGDLVHEYHWLTQQQLLDAVAIGQFTPGPLLSTATFIGYLLLGVPGAIIATLAIFLPSFVFVAVLNPIIPHLRRSPWSSAFLDAVNVSSIALLGVVAAQLARATLVSWPAGLIAGLAAVAALRWNINASWLVLGGAGLGWVFSRLVG
jgi:chromate transporter